MLAASDAAARWSCSTTSSPFSSTSSTPPRRPLALAITPWPTLARHNSARRRRDSALLRLRMVPPRRPWLPPRAVARPCCVGLLDSMVVWWCGVVLLLPADRRTMVRSADLCFDDLAASLDYGFACTPTAKPSPPLAWSPPAWCPRRRVFSFLLLDAGGIVPRAQPRHRLHYLLPLLRCELILSPLLCL
jgi:hypothetical protein